MNVGFRDRVFRGIGGLLLLVIDFLAGNQLSLGTYSIKILTSYFASNNPEQFIIEDGIVVI